MKASHRYYFIILFVQFSIALQTAESYASYGYAPTKTGHLGEKEYSPYLDIGYPQRVFWGDTHLHTSYSTDAGMIGNRLSPHTAIFPTGSWI